MMSTAKKGGKIPRLIVSTGSMLLRLNIVIMVAASAFLSCSADDVDNFFADPGYALRGPHLLRTFYTDPGTTRDNGVDKKIDVELIKMIDNAEKKVLVAVYNLGHTPIMNAIINAKGRGLDVRMVGDVDEVVTDGYRTILRTDIPFSMGNTTAIHHNKFFLIDDKYAFMGTGNITSSGFLRNNENFVLLESPSIVRAFTAEFDQMFYGKYGAKKVPLTTDYNHRVNLSRFEVYFSPYDGQRAMDRLIQLVDGAKNTVHYMIFAHTHDELDVAKTRAARRGVVVRGVHDDTFINGVSEEAPRFFSSFRHIYGDGAAYVRGDGNENTNVPGIKAHGGKLHTKTMIIDGSIVATGSFNFSTNAVKNNDENMLIIHDPFVAQEILKQWEGIWGVSKAFCCGDGRRLRHTSGDKANPGDIVISEVMWAGSWESGESFENKDDDWLELYNTTDRDIDISHWAMSWETSERTFYPIPDRYNWYEPGVASRHRFGGKIVIPAKRFGIINARNGALDNSDNRVSGTKNFTLASGQLHIRLYDPTMTLIDEAGIGDPPFAGKVDTFYKRLHSMERFFHPGTGKALPGKYAGSWYTSNGNGLLGSSAAGVGQLGTDFRNGTIGTPFYSGNFVTLTSASNARGGVNGHTNVPVRAYSTGATSAVIQMRWAMQSAPGVTQATICGGACTVELDSNDPSSIKVTTGAQTAGTRYTFTVASTALDMTGQVAEGGTISFTGNMSPATLEIDRVYPGRSGSKDIIVLRALTAGTVSNLGIYIYDTFAVTPTLLYRMNDVPVTAGQYIQVNMGHSCDTPCSLANIRPEDAQIGLANTYDITTNPSSGLDQTGLTGNDTWSVFSPLNIVSTDGVVFISYDLNRDPMDMMCYSNQDGSVPETLMIGGFTSMANQNQAVYHFPHQPVFQVNDYLVQRQCTHLKTTSGNSVRLARVKSGSASANNYEDFEFQQ